MKFTITLTIEAPEGSLVQVTPAAAFEPSGPVYVPPFEDELIPLPEGAIPIGEEGIVYASRTQPTQFRAPTLAAQVAMCPVHLKPWKLVPAGVSKRTGRPYGEFFACPEKGCDQRPAA